VVPVLLERGSPCLSVWEDTWSTAQERRTHRYGSRRNKQPRHMKCVHIKQLGQVWRSRAIFSLVRLAARLPEADLAELGTLLVVTAELVPLR